MRHLTLLFSLLLLASCASVEDPWLDGISTAATAGSAGAGVNRELNPQLAAADIPAIGASPIAVRQLSSEDGSVQQIVYPNRATIAGENMLVVREVAAGSSAARKAPTSAELAREMRKAMPGVAMDVTPVLGSNAYGPYGAARGTLPSGGGCVYAWQVVNRPSAAFGQGAKAVQVRLRYCDADRKAEELVSLLSSLTLSSGRAIAMAPLAY
ncbi:MAG: cellulose biosynthesis protein BcsN [Allorhizobium sp.]